MLPLFFILNLISLFSINFAFNLTQERRHHLEEMIKSQREQAKLHTFGIVVTNKNKTIFQNIFSENKQLTNDTLFIIGNISYSFTALAVLKSGIDLNKKLSEFDLAKYIKDEYSKKITVSELLNHTSGLESYGSRIIDERKGKYNFSNYGYALLGKIIENKNGMKYNDFMKKYIFKSLGMDNTWAEYREDIIESYDNLLGFRVKYRGLESEIEDGFYAPAGFISTTLEDMGKYLRYYLNTDSDDYKNYISRMLKSNLSIGYKEYYGMGLIIGEKNGTMVIHHDGRTNSFSSHLFVYPELDLGFFIVTNTNDLSCFIPTEQLFENIENFLLFDTHKGIHSNLFLQIHFTIDIAMIILLVGPFAYLIITIVGKCKRMEYAWFKGRKGIITFIMDLIILLLLPLTIIIYLYIGNVDYRKKAFESSKDLQFFIFTLCSISFFIFIIKLVYIFIYKYIKKNEKVDDKKNDQNNPDYMLGEMINDIID